LKVQALAKAPAAEKKQKSNTANDIDVETADLEEAIIASVDEAARESRVEKPPVPTMSLRSSAAFDTSGLSRAGNDIQQHLLAIAQTVEAASQGWELLNGEIQRSGDEITRLRAAELDRARLIEQLDERTATIARLESEVNEAKAGTTAAAERASKLEEVVEGIKERALELHTSLQDARTKEEKQAADIESLRSQLADAGRQAQDESVARIAAEEKIAKLEGDYKRLESDEMAGRDRLAKIMDDNKTMAAQVPALLMDRDRWQKQLSASERENARLVSERQTLAARISDFEEEIRTLRADLGSLTVSAGSSVAVAAPTRPPLAAPSTLAAPSVAEVNETKAFELNDEDLDLEASLERVFAQDMADFNDKDAKH